MKLRASLSDNNIAALGSLAAINFNSKPFADAIAIFGGCPSALFMCHEDLNFADFIILGDSIVVFTECQCPLRYRLIYLIRGYEFNLKLDFFDENL